MLKKAASRRGRPGESPVFAQRAASEEQEGSSQTILLARITRTMKRCSLGTRARLGALGVGRVRMLRAVKDSLAVPLMTKWGKSEDPRPAYGTSWRVGVGRVKSLAFLRILLGQGRHMYGCRLGDR
jgi:hypothetical protein